MRASQQRVTDRECKNSLSRRGAVRPRLAAGTRRASHPRQPGRTGRTVPRSVRARARLRRTRRDRRALPVGLHAGAEHGAGQPHLRHPPRDIGIPRRAVDGPPRPAIFRAGSNRTGAGGLSVAGAGLDSPPWRVDVAAAVAARTRAGVNLSVVQVGGDRQLICPSGRISVFPKWLSSPSAKNIPVFT
jgi:hypothetical protein